MSKYGRATRILHTCLVGAVVIGTLAATNNKPHRSLQGTIWVANRGSNTIRGFDARTGAEISTIDMAPASQPGDLAFANGKLYVSEEFGATPTPAIAIVDPETAIIHRIFTPTGSRPHHVHASRKGDLIAVGLYGTDMVAVVDTYDDALLGMWKSHLAPTPAGRVHAAVFSPDGKTLYLANEGSNELIAMDPRTGNLLWSLAVTSIHELAVTRDSKTAYVSRRTANRLAVVDLENRTVQDVLTLGLPDTLRLAAGGKVLTVGLRTQPAQLAVVDTRKLTYDLVNLSAAGETTTIAGHQWTSKNGRYTFASFEGGTSQGVAVIDHRAGNNVVQRLPYPGRPHGVDRERQ